jgi:ATP phosphoribosyltransferase regulatory subunit
MKTEYSGKIKLDFSVVNDMNYYNGIVFKGFLSGICEGVLSGGEYGRLMRRMGRRSDAVGFALYLDLLEELNFDRIAYDVDVLLVYDEKTKAECVSSKVKEIIALGKTVTAQRKIPEKLRYKEILYMESEV